MNEMASATGEFPAVTTKQTAEALSESLHEAHVEQEYRDRWAMASMIVGAALALTSFTMLAFYSIGGQW